MLQFTCTFWTLVHGSLHSKLSIRPECAYGKKRQAFTEFVYQTCELSSAHAHTQWCFVVVSITHIRYAVRYWLSPFRSLGTWELGHLFVQKMLCTLKRKPRVLLERFLLLRCCPGYSARRGSRGADTVFGNDCRHCARFWSQRYCLFQQSTWKA
jgi:hypothetical protein